MRPRIRPQLHDYDQPQKAHRRPKMYDFVLCFRIESLAIRQCVMLRIKLQPTQIDNVLNLKSLCRSSKTVPRSRPQRD